MMKPIVTLTLNPTIDGSAQAEKVQPIHKVRIFQERYDPGGGGINVARVIQELGGSSLAVYLAGGATGAVLDELLATANIKTRRIPIKGHTRVSHAIFERSSGLEYRFVPEGPDVEEAEWRACLSAVEELDCDYLVASGSLPPGVPADFYARIAGITAEKGIRMVLDTSGKALAEGLKGGVFLVKPSLGELEGLVGRKLPEPADQEMATSELVRSGATEMVALTMGHDGALLASKEGVVRLPALDLPTQSAVGAGDSFVAAMTLALAEGRNRTDAFACGMAAGSAAVLTPGTELCRKEDVERLLVEIRNGPSFAQYR
jgi:6-phosphofructokinase 2